MVRAQAFGNRGDSPDGSTGGGDQEMKRKAGLRCPAARPWGPVP